MGRGSKWFRAHYQCPDPNMSGSYRGGYTSWNDSENSIFYQAQEKDDKTQYEPSKSLRSLIVERLQAQQKMLIRLNTQIGTLIIAAGEGEANSAAGNKGPGDTQISAQQVKMLRPTRENIAESYRAAVVGHRRTGLRCAGRAGRPGSHDAQRWSFERSFCKVSAVAAGDQWALGYGAAVCLDAGGDE